MSVLNILDEYINNNPNNYISKEKALTPSMEGLRIYDKPLIGIADASDPLFDKMLDPQVIGPHFMKPQQWLSNAKSVISVFLPYSEAIKLANSNTVNDIAIEWLHGRVEGQNFLLQVGEFIKATIESHGFRAIIPFMDEHFWLVENHEEGYTSNWSERHIAFICGLGTFSLSRSLITKAGSAGRFISVVTNMELPVTKRDYTDIYEYCSHCGACIARCPAKAISLEFGKNQELCGDFVHHTRTDYPAYYGCGKCQTGVPCQSSIPKK